MKVELHCHTREGSLCGRLPSAEVVTLHKKAGYDGLVVTNHFNLENLEVFSGNFREKVDQWLDGYRLARETGEQCGVKVFFGLEARNTANYNDYLIYGITPEEILRCENLCLMPLEEIKKVCESLDAVLIQAHPFRHGCTPASVQLLDGLEVFNANPDHDSHNDQAKALADANPRLIQIAGSDFHREAHLGRASVTFDNPPETEKALAEVLRAGGFKRHEGY